MSRSSDVLSALFSGPVLGKRGDVAGGVLPIKVDMKTQESVCHRVGDTIRNVFRPYAVVGKRLPMIADRIGARLDGDRVDTLCGAWPFGLGVTPWPASISQRLANRPFIGLALPFCCLHLV
jgi:hypothetical protein